MNREVPSGGDERGHPRASDSADEWIDVTESSTSQAPEESDPMVTFVDDSVVQHALEARRAVELRGTQRSVVIGRGMPVRVNTNIGISSRTPHAQEFEKVKMLATLPYGPDLVMDHTIDHKARNFWKEIVDLFPGPVGSLPQYTAYRPSTGLDPAALLERIEEMLEGGVAFMTLHFTADLDLYEQAAAIRDIPVTSRGGGLAIKSMIASHQKENAFRASYHEIVQLFKKHSAAISVGTTFRPADVNSAMDPVHLAETSRQLDIVRDLKASGVKCLMEGVGHVSLDVIPRYVELIAEGDCPFMPLGPMVTDSAIGFDHVTNAIGGAVMASLGAASVINSVTREEHTGGVPTHDSVIEGLMAARVAAHAANVALFPAAKKVDELTVQQRGRQVSCVVSGGLFGVAPGRQTKGCKRCDFECPIILAPSRKQRIA